MRSPRRPPPRHRCRRHGAARGPVRGPGPRVHRHVPGCRARHALGGHAARISLRLPMAARGRGRSETCDRSGTSCAQRHRTVPVDQCSAPLQFLRWWRRHGLRGGAGNEGPRARRHCADDIEPVGPHLHALQTQGRRRAQQEARSRGGPEDSGPPEKADLGRPRDVREHRLDGRARSGAQILAERLPERDQGARGPHAGPEARERLFAGAEGAGPAGAAADHLPGAEAREEHRRRQVRRALQEVQADQRAAPGGHEWGEQPVRPSGARRPGRERAQALQGVREAEPPARRVAGRPRPARGTAEAGGGQARVAAHGAPGRAGEGHPRVARGVREGLQPPQVRRPEV
mmetsp:Transcript_26778/g.76816  ORF Transcript_26778/g.76816 Transcript_26778/m.76816 type:complete len:345 (+) Transcript_26778:2008-3042(+)